MKHAKLVRTLSFDLCRIVFHVKKLLSDLMINLDSTPQLLSIKIGKEILLYENKPHQVGLSADD